MLTSANRCRTAPSVLEAPVGQPVINLQGLGLAGRVFAPKGEEADLVPVQIHVTANQTIGPDCADPPGLPQQRYLALGVGSTQVDQPTTRPVLQVQLPDRREYPAVRGRLDARHALLAQRLHMPAGMLLQVLEVGVLEARPDLGLPPAVVALDHGLEAALAWRHERRDDGHAQAPAAAPPQSPGK